MQLKFRGRGQPVGRGDRLPGRCEQFHRLSTSQTAHAFLAVEDSHDLPNGAPNTTQRRGNEACADDTGRAINSKYVMGQLGFTRASPQHACVIHNRGGGVVWGANSRASQISGRILQLARIRPGQKGSDLRLAGGVICNQITASVRAQVLPGRRGSPNVYSPNLGLFHSFEAQEIPPPRSSRGQNIFELETRALELKTELIVGLTVVALDHP